MAASSGCGSCLLSPASSPLRFSNLERGSSFKSESGLFCPATKDYHDPNDSRFHFSQRIQSPEGQQAFCCRISALTWSLDFRSETARPTLPNSQFPVPRDSNRSTFATPPTRRSTKPTFTHKARCRLALAEPGLLLPSNLSMLRWYCNSGTCTRYNPESGATASYPREAKEERHP